MPLKNKKEENILDNNPNFSVEKSNDVKDVDFLASASESEKIVEKKRVVITMFRNYEIYTDRQDY